MRVFQASQLPSLSFSIFGAEVDVLMALELLATTVWVDGTEATDDWDADPDGGTAGGGGINGGGPGGSGGCDGSDMIGRIWIEVVIGASRGS